jgi:hypothetical protein
MPGKQKMTRVERQHVRTYLQTMLEHADTASRRLREVQSGQAPDFVLKNIAYWDNVRSGFRWAIAQLKHY